MRLLESLREIHGDKAEDILATFLKKDDIEICEHSGDPACDGEEHHAPCNWVKSYYYECPFCYGGGPYESIGTIDILHTTSCDLAKRIEGLRALLETKA